VSRHFGERDEGAFKPSARRLRLRLSTLEVIRHESLRSLGKLQDWKRLISVVLDLERKGSIE
jgi:hypothetical protein